MLCGEERAVVVGLLEAGGVAHPPVLRDRLVVLAHAPLLELEPHPGGRVLRPRERVALRGGVPEELIVHPEAGDAADVLGGERDLRGREPLGEAIHREFLRLGAGNDVDVRRQRILEAAAGGEGEDGEEQGEAGREAIHLMSRGRCPSTVHRARWSAAPARGHPAASRPRVA
jgi:hypothetical protein